MKKIIIFCLTTIFFSCKEESKSNEPICFYYTQTIQDTTTVDTIPFRGFIRIDSLGELLATEKFKYNNTYHQIKMFSTDKYAPIDGGELYYTLDNIYCMYSRSTCWSNFGILSSNNDSINEILKVAITIQYK